MGSYLRELNKKPKTKKKKTKRKNCQTIPKPTAAPAAPHANAPPLAPAKPKNAAPAASTANAAPTANAKTTNNAATVALKIVKPLNLVNANARKIPIVVLVALTVNARINVLVRVRG